MTNFSFAGYGKGSTNGQRRMGSVIVINANDKAEAQAAALKHLKCYKVLGNRMAYGESPFARQRSLEDLYGKPVEVLDLNPVNEPSELSDFNSVMSRHHY